MLLFCLFQYFEEKEYQTESKRSETFGSIIFGTNLIRRAWSASQESSAGPTREEGVPPCRARPPVSWAPRASTDVLLPPIYIHGPRKHPGAPRNTISTTVTFCIREISSWSLRRHSACRILGSSRPLRLKHWGARRDHTSSLPMSHRLAKN